MSTSGESGIKDHVHSVYGRLSGSVISAKQDIAAGMDSPVS